MRQRVRCVALLVAAPVWAAEEPSGCDKFKWPIERERAGADGAGSLQLHRAQARGDARAGRDPHADRSPARPSCRHRPSVRPRTAHSPASPASRLPKAGSTIGLSRRLVDVVQEGISSNRRLQRRHRLRRHPQDHEIRARQASCPVAETKYAELRGYGGGGHKRQHTIDAPAAPEAVSRLYPVRQPAIVSHWRYPDRP